MTEPRTRRGALMAALRENGVAGRWTPGTLSRPGPRGASHKAHRNAVWGPDGFVLALVRDQIAASVEYLNRTGVRRPVLIQQIRNGMDGSEREVVRMELSDFLDLLAVYTQWLAQEGRLGQDE